MTRSVAARPAPDGRSPGGRAEITVRQDLATGVDALHVVTGQVGTEPARLARAVAAARLDGAGMVVVEAPLSGPVPAGPDRPATPGRPGRPADDGCDLLRLYRDLAEHPPAPGPPGPPGPGAATGPAGAAVRPRCRPRTRRWPAGW